MAERLKDIGECELIRRLKNLTNTSASVIKGIGDDCAVLKYTKDKYLLFTTDMIIEGVHFKKGSRPESIGHKALAVNISDIAACGGIPKWAVVSIGMPQDTSYNYIRRIYIGIEHLSDKLRVDIVGGDTNASRQMVISVALIGEVKRNKLVLRSGARDKDIIFLSGHLTERPNHLTFMPQMKESQYLVENFHVNSMIDISDGFWTDLNHILSESKKSAIVYEALIPYRGEKRLLRNILNTGEQFKLIFTAARPQTDKLSRVFFPVGEITDERGGIIYVTKKGRGERALPAGYTHF